MQAPKLLAMPSITFEVSMYCAMRSPAPKPFWMVRTTPSDLMSFEAACAAAPTPDAFVAMTTRSHGGTSDVSSRASKCETKSPFGPSTRRPFSLIFCTCSFQTSTAQTSLPAAAKKPAYTDPIAPQPRIAMVFCPSPTFRRFDPGSAAGATTSFPSRSNFEIKLETKFVVFSSSTVSATNAAHLVPRARGLPMACCTVMKCPSKIMDPGS
mmetsp:Transcript_20600/g.37048  ORF Transcript_20600/g.37048 Transcript_20600/m.37048 type:complete len:210 (-) Transcript_20600:563-1192(-)